MQLKKSTVSFDKKIYKNSQTHSNITIDFEKCKSQS